MDLIKDKLNRCKDFIFTHLKIIMPIVLLICVAITVVIALGANRRDKLEQEAVEQALADAAAKEALTPADTDGLIETPDYELAKHEDDEVYDLVRSYYDARANGDLLTASAINTYLKDVQKINMEELSKFIESYPSLEVYTKPGLSDNSYVAFVCSEVKFNDYDKTLPGMQVYYIGTDESGNYFLNDGTYDDAIYEYIVKLTLQDDVVDLNNRVTVAYNDTLEKDEEFSEFMAYLKEKVKEEVGERVAQLEVPEPVTDTPAEPAADTARESQVTVVTKVKATDVVNIRVSDSEQADKLGKASVGQEFTLVEQKPNGWTEVEYEGKTAFIKSDYLEASETVVKNGEDVADASADDNGGDEGNDTTEETQTDTGNTKTGGTVTVLKSGVRLRKEPNTDSDILDTVYTGTQLELIEALSSGWSRIKYKGQEGYVKSEFVKVQN